jgi:Arc/MetJ-type ribon-helix-helix transcriptional regulator
LKAIDVLCGDARIYPSRSELIRVAVREFLCKELEAANAFTSFQKQNALSQMKKQIPQQNVDETVEIEEFFHMHSKK